LSPLVLGSSAALFASAALLLEAAFSLVGLELGLLSSFLLLCLEPDGAGSLLLPLVLVALGSSLLTCF
jgi:hypothetical protein